VDEVGRAGELLDVAVQSGATATGGVRFDLRDREGAEREALRLAVVDARARAEAAAAGAGRAIDHYLNYRTWRTSLPRRWRDWLTRCAAAASDSG